MTRPTKPPPADASLPWPTYGADNARLRAVGAAGLRPPFRKLWTFHGRHLLEFPPVVGYGSIFEEVFDGRLYSIDPASGRTRWRYTSHGCGWSSPALADHLVFATFIGNRECNATMQGGRIVAFSPATGHIRWSRTIGPSESSPLVEDGTLYAADQDGYVYAFDARTGHLRWRFNTGAPIKASPAFAYGRIYIGNYAAEMLALDARTGRLIWRSFGGFGNFYSTASVNAGRVYVGSLDDRVYAFSARTGAVLWSSGTEATSTPRRPSGTGSSSSARTTTRSTPSMRRPEPSSGRSRRTARSPARQPSSTASSISPRSSGARTGSTR